ncbi:hypothetical protein Pfo_027440 [Paulownia fortunei]|nr:hypothetical protein Pfo_027440 [Paulownia fortunei]
MLSTIEYAKKIKAKNSPSHKKSKQQDDGVEGSKTKNTFPPHRDHVKGGSSLTEVGPLKELVLHLTKLDAKKPSPQPLEGFVHPTQEAETEHGVCIGIQNTKCFDSKAYKLLVKAGYNPKESSILGKLLPEIISEQVGHVVQSIRIGIGFVPQNPPSALPSKESAPIMLLKVKLQTIIFTQTQDDKDDRESVASSYHITLSEEIEKEDAEVAPPELEEGVKATVDELKEINLGDFKDIFAWSYKEMPGLDPKVAVHHLSLVLLIEAEVNKLIEVGFIREVNYPTWISSIVPMRKKNGQIRVCVDFRDLNYACPKDDFSLPITELMIDATTGHEALSFMDRSSRYNQIRMAPKDEELTAFCTPKDIYCYKVMLFGLKNIGATYQRPMHKIFDDMLYKNIECYVDDVVIKKVLERLKRYQLKMNPLKCTFGVGLKKIEQAKIDAILKMPEPQDIHELKSLQEKLAYLRRFILNLAGRCHSFSRFMKKGISFEWDKSCRNAISFKWDKSCRNAFENIKTYVMKPPVLVAPVPGHPLILYIATQEYSVGPLLAQENNDGKEILEDFLTDNPIPTEWELFDDLPDEDVFVIEITPPWKTYFDGASHKKKADAGVIFITSDGEVLSYSFTLIQNYSNNVAEYQALIFGLEMVVDIKQLHLKVYGDSKLVVNQLLGLYEVKKPELLPYFNYVRRLIGWLGDVVIEHIPRTDNKQADALANLTFIVAMPEGKARVSICRSWVVPPIFEDENYDEDEENHIVEVFEKEDWCQPLVDYLKYEKLPDDPRQRVDIQRRAARFIHYKSTLYRCSFDGVFLRCLGDDKAIQAIEKAHFGICGAHQSGLKLYCRIKIMDYTQRCQACQFHANLIHQPPEPLHPNSSGGYLYILAATDYFSKYIITDNGKPFCNSLIDKLCQKFSFKQKKSSIYYATANGLAEAFNKTLCTLLKKVIAKSKRDWQERIEEALWAYRTTFRTPTQATPYALMYGVEAIVPLEQQIPSLRIAIQEGLTEEENARLRLEELEAIDEKRLKAQQRLECYQTRLYRVFNKKVQSRSFQVGNLVLADGPYVVKEVYTNGAYKLVVEDGLRIGSINRKFLKRYYA